MNLRLYLPLLFFSTLAPALRAQKLEVVEPVKDTLTVWNQTLSERLERQGWVSSLSYDSAAQVVVGKHLTGGYEEDERGQVYNFGALGQPFVVLAAFDTKNVYPALYDEIAKEFADEVLCFLLVAAPHDSLTEQRLLATSDTLIRIYDYDFEFKPFEERATQRLLGLLHGHAFYFVDQDRRIVNIWTAYLGYSHLRRKARRRTHKSLRREIRGLLRHHRKQQAQRGKP